VGSCSNDYSLPLQFATVTAYPFRPFALSSFSHPSHHISPTIFLPSPLSFFTPSHIGLNFGQLCYLVVLCYNLHSVWVPGLRIDPLRLLAGCHKRRLNQAPLNLRGLIWLLMMVWSKKGNINTAALVTIAQCNTLVAWCSRQLIGPADWVIVTLGPLRCD